MKRIAAGCRVVGGLPEPPVSGLVTEVPAHCR